MSRTTIQIRAVEPAAMKSVVASADVETTEPPVPWKLIVIALLEHGGSADMSEICQHLIGADRHPLLDRLFAMGEHAGDLLVDAGRWYVSAGAATTLATDDHRRTRSAEVTFVLSDEPLQVVDVQLDTSGRLSDVIFGGQLQEATAEQAAAVRAVQGRRFLNGLTVVDVREPIFQGDQVEVDSPVPQSLNQDEEDAVVKAVLPTGFRWDASVGVLRSSLASAAVVGDVLRTRTYSGRVESVVLPDGRKLREIEIEGIRWVPDEELSAREAAMARVVLSTATVLDEAQWVRALEGLPEAANGVSRREVGDLALRLGLRRQHRLIMAAEDWAL